MITIQQNNRENIKYETTDYFDEAADEVREFHMTFTDYKPTPLLKLNGLSKYLGVKEIWLKDESYRFGLNAFKVLGASYAAAKVLNELLKLNEDQISFSLFQNHAVNSKLKDLTFVTATDGNHGRGVAWTAQQIGCKCVIYMPKGSAKVRLNNIKSHDAQAYIIDGNYDEAVSLARINSKKYGWILIQDSSWKGYEKIPTWIMNGYFTLMEEINEQLNDEIPTHIFIQCGNGSLPASILAYCIKKYKKEKPVFAVVEPEDAACVYESFLKHGLTTLYNEMKTIMAGLACGTPSLLAWNILKDHSDFFIKCSDDVTIKGMQILGNGEFENTKIISGESGAVTTGLIYSLLSEQKHKTDCNLLGLNQNSKILLLSTEGNTDPETYDKIISQKTDLTNRGGK